MRSPFDGLNAAGVQRVAGVLQYPRSKGANGAPSAPQGQVRLTPFARLNDSAVP